MMSCASSDCRPFELWTRVPDRVPGTRPGNKAPPHHVLRESAGPPVAATGGPADSRRTWCGGALFPGRVPGTRSGTRVHSSKGLQSLDAQDIIDRYDGGYFFLDPSSLSGSENEWLKVAPGERESVGGFCHLVLPWE